MLNKLLTGEFRVGVAQTLVVRRWREAAGTDADDDRGATDGRLAAVGGVVHSLVASQTHRAADPSQPYPFFLAAPLEDDPRRSAIARLAGRMEMGRHPRAAGAARGETSSSGRAAKS